MNMMQDGERYTRMPYRRTGRSGLLLPAISLGLWQNFGHDRPLDTQRSILGRAFATTRPNRGWSSQMFIFAKWTGCGRFF